MELIIYGTFLALSLLAYGARRVANKGDEKKISISNINFKRYSDFVINRLFLLCCIAFRRVSSLYISLHCLVTGCRDLMCTSSTLFMGSKNPRLPSFMLLVSHQVWCLGLVLDLWQIFGEEGEKVIQNYFIIFV